MSRGTKSTTARFSSRKNLLRNCAKRSVPRASSGQRGQTSVPRVYILGEVRTHTHTHREFTQNVYIPYTRLLPRRVVGAEIGQRQRGASRSVLRQRHPVGAGGGQGGRLLRLDWHTLGARQGQCRHVPHGCANDWRPPRTRL